MKKALQHCSSGQPLRRQRSKCTTPRRMETDSIQFSFQHILFRPVSDNLPCQNPYTMRWLEYRMNTSSSLPIRKNTEAVESIIPIPLLPPTMPMFRPVVVHEFGHSFGGLADEYFYDNDVMTDTYPLDVEPWEQNISTRIDFISKWEDMLAQGTPVPTPSSESGTYPVGVYEGAGYSAKGIYRPADNCRMRTNEYPTFCPVCQRAIRRVIEFYTE